MIRSLRKCFGGVHRKRIHTPKTKKMLAWYKAGESLKRPPAIVAIPGHAREH